MYRTPLHLLLAALLALNSAAMADVALDGSLGPAGALDGPDYRISAELGQQAGSNLFHSFSRFGLDSGESATFSGPDSVQNIIGRVTGGAASEINGKLATEIPGADLYLINPAGLVFGPDATLEVQGSFHAASADHVRFSDGQRFPAQAGQTSQLSSAAPTAFGFLSAQPAAMQVSSSALSVPQGQRLILAGGSLALEAAQLSAPQGQITLATGSGELDLASPDGFTGGELRMTDNALVDVSGEGGGNVVIRAGRFFASDSQVMAKTLGSQDGGEINIKAGEVALEQGARLIGDTVGTGNGSAIHIQASRTVNVRGENADGYESLLSARSGIYEDLTEEDLGDAGEVRIEAENITFENGAGIWASTYGGGEGSDIYLQADETIRFAGESTRNDSYIAASTYRAEPGGGTGGDVHLAAKNIRFEQGAYLSASTDGSGDAGDVLLQADEKVLFSGEDSLGYISQLQASTTGLKAGAGNGGNVQIEANDIVFEKGAYITSSTVGSGRGGDVSLSANNSVVFSGESHLAQELKTSAPSRIEVGTFSSGAGGSLTVKANDIELREGAVFSNKTSGSGQAGNINLNSTNIILLTGYRSSGWGSEIRADNSETSTGTAGTVTIKTGDLDLQDGANISSTAFGAGDAGGVNIQASGTVNVAGANPLGWASMVFSNSNPKQAEGRASNSGGQGGQIEINANRLQLRDGGQIAASSIAPDGLQSGDAGQVTIHAEEVAISGANPYGENEDGFGSGIYARSTGVEAGRGGSITVETDHLALRDGGMISSATDNRATGGDISISLTNGMEIGGLADPVSLPEPPSAQQEYRDKFPDTEALPAISGIYASSTSRAEQAGAAGNITFNASGMLHITGNAKVSTEALNAGGGLIKLNAEPGSPDNAVLYLQSSQISTSVQRGGGNGGDMVLNPSFIVQDSGRIQGNAWDGAGGHLRITSNGIYRFPPEGESRIEATSYSGPQGIVDISSPDIDLSSELVILQTQFISDESLRGSRCGAQAAEQASSFVISRRAGVATCGREDYLPGGIVSE